MKKINDALLFTRNIKLFSVFTLLLCFNFINSMNIPNDIQRIIFLNCDNNSQDILPFVCKSFYNLSKDIISRQTTYLDKLVQARKENDDAQFNRLINTHDLCDRYVRTHICELLGIDNALENNKIIYYDIQYFKKDILLYAIEQDSRLATYVCIKQNVDDLIIDDYPALIKAYQLHKYIIVKLFFTMGITVNRVNQSGVTALMVAAYYGHMDIAQLLCKYGANVNVVDDDGWTALIWTTKCGHMRMVQLLLEYGADVNSAETDGWTVLMLTSLHGCTAIAQLLIDKDANVNAVDDDGRSALRAAAQNGHIEIVKLLLEYGANVNATDNDGITVLMAAVLHENTKMVQLLLEYGADVNMKTNNGNTAFSWATPEIEKILCKEI